MDNDIVGRFLNLSVGYYFSQVNSGVSLESFAL